MPASLLDGKTGLLMMMPTRPVSLPAGQLGMMDVEGTVNDLCDHYGLISLDFHEKVGPGAADAEAQHLRPPFPPSHPG